MKAQINPDIAGFKIQIIRDDIEIGESVTIEMSNGVATISNTVGGMVDSVFISTDNLAPDNFSLTLTVDGDTVYTHLEEVQTIDALSIAIGNRAQLRDYIDAQTDAMTSTSGVSAAKKKELIERLRSRCLHKRINEINTDIQLLQDQGKVLVDEKSRLQGLII